MKKRRGNKFGRGAGKRGTSWGHVASWYHEHVTESDDTYHEQVIKPGLLDALGDVRGKHVLDVACGQGFFSRAIHRGGAHVTGIDIAPELIDIAKKTGPVDITYMVASADRIPLFRATYDAAVCALALQNIKNLSGTIEQVSKLLKKGGVLAIVLNHPAFRIPRRSSWGYDPDVKIQFRRLDGYLSESSHTIQMHPGSDPRATTLSYHRPLKTYVAELAKHGFSIIGLEEWVSHRKSESGPRSRAEDRARKEFPLFLMLKARKN